VALEIRGEALRPLLASELAIAGTAGWHDERFVRWLQAPSPALARDAPADGTLAGIATEGAIREALLKRLGGTGAGDAIDVAMFYLGDRRTVVALRSAARRGATVRVLLDANKDAFGFTKIGIPNRDVARELTRAGITLRWYPTRGEQFHVKFAAVRSGGRLWFTLGSANFTSRNLGDYNLEANALVETPAGTPLAAAVGDWFESLWATGTGPLPGPGLPRYWLYRFMEVSGTSTF
jgi:phosphatidylserine/phosphatidylglycerophosphate/cardiolipin synthase-like enzyme